MSARASHPTVPPLQADPVYGAAVLATYLLSGGEPGVALEAAVAADVAAGASPAGTSSVAAWELGGDV